MTNREKYIEFYNQHPDICIFSSPWWLDSVAGKENWDVVLVQDKGENIIASFPYVVSYGKLHGKNLTMPQLTQKLGPYMVYGSNKMSEMKRIAFEHKVYNQIINMLPRFNWFSISFEQSYKNWLPFYWAGFQQTSRYSYRLSNLKDIDGIFAGFDKAKRQKVKRGIENFTLCYDLSLDDFYNYLEKVIVSRGEKVSYSKEVLSLIYNEVYEHNAGRVLYCKDKITGEIGAIQLLVYDSTVCYCLVGIRDKKFNSLGSTEFLFYECIKYASNFVDIFDFEGSMIKGVEESYRTYGAHQTEYYSITKENSKIKPLLRALRNLLIK